MNGFFDFLLQYWIEFALGLIASALTIIFKVLFGRLKSWKKEQELVKNGVLAILHDRLYQSCRHYIDENEIMEFELKNIESLYKAYHPLGGNGTGTELYERVLDLPLKKKK